MVVGELVKLTRGTVLYRVRQIDDRRLKPERVALRLCRVLERGGDHIYAGYAQTVQRRQVVQTARRA